MGFNMKSLGHTLPCAIKCGKVMIGLPTKEIRTFDTTCDKEVEWQVNFFSSTYVAFWLRDDTFDYYGRFDGTLSIVRSADNLLYSLSHWSPPMFWDLEPVGYGIVNGYLTRVYRDGFDFKSLYGADVPMIGVLETASNFKWSEAESYAMAQQGKHLATNTNLLFLYDKEGINHGAKDIIVPSMEGWNNRRNII